MARSKEDYKKIVNALYAKAAATEFPEEKETYETQAAEIMAKYGIERAMDKDAEDKVIHETYTFQAPFAKQKAVLYNNMAKRFRCSVVQSKGIYHLFGYQSDYDQLEFLFAIIINQAFVELSKVDIPDYESKKSFKVSWWYGFTVKIAERLDAVNKSATSAADSGYGIVLYDRNRAVLNDRNKAFPSLRKTSGGRVGSRSGWQSGQTAGANANFHNQGSVSGGRMELS